MKWAIPTSCHLDSVGPPTEPVSAIRRIAGRRLQEFPGAYLKRGRPGSSGALTSHPTMLRKDYGRETQ